MGTSLAGFWDRGRKLLRLFGQQWDPAVQPVMIVADSREPCGQPDSYRGFLIAYAGAGHVVATCLKIRCELLNGMVVESFGWAHTAIGAAPGVVLRALDPVAAAADGAAYLAATDLSTLSACWSDNPSAGRPPIGWSTGGTVAAGVQLLGLPVAASNHVPIYNYRIFIPFGGVLNVQYVQGTANETFCLQCYAR